jgi:hypothetical protein
VRGGRCTDQVKDERARPGSIVGYADERHRLAGILLFGTPVATLLLGECGVLAAVLGFAEVAFVTLLDVLDWAQLGRDARRMAAGEQPTEPNADYGVGDDCWTAVVPAAVPYRGMDRTVLLARGSPAAARDVIGANLGRRATLGFVCASVCVFLVASELVIAGEVRCHGDRMGSTRVGLSSIRSATILYLNAHPAVCPTSVDVLRREHLLDSGFPPTDPWGNRPIIRCDGDEITVTSAGRDRKEGTEDDVIVPTPSQ